MVDRSASLHMVLQPSSGAGLTSFKVVVIVEVAQAHGGNLLATRATRLPRSASDCFQAGRRYCSLHIGPGRPYHARTNLDTYYALPRISYSTTAKSGGAAAFAHSPITRTGATRSTSSHPHPPSPSSRQTVVSELPLLFAPPRRTSRALRYGPPSRGS